MYIFGGIYMLKLKGSQEDPVDVAKIIREELSRKKRYNEKLQLIGGEDQYKLARQFYLQHHIPI